MSDKKQIAYLALITFLLGGFLIAQSILVLVGISYLFDVGGFLSKLVALWAVAGSITGVCVAVDYIKRTFD